MRLSTIILHVPDVDLLDRCRDWYTRLGLQPSGDTPGESTWFNIGNGMTFGIHTAGTMTDPAAVTVYFEVANVDAAYANLAASGFEFVSKPEDKPWGGRAVALRDPAGYDVQLMTPRPD